MGIVADILKAAIERQNKLTDQHMADVQEKCEAANEQLRKSSIEIRVEQLAALTSLVKGEAHTTPPEKSDE